MLRKSYKFLIKKGDNRQPSAVIALIKVIEMDLLYHNFLAIDNV